MTPSEPKTETRLADQAEALGVYLEALLVERPASLPVAVTPAPPRPIIELPATALRVVTEAPPPVTVRVDTPPAPTPAPTLAAAAATTAAAAPDWAAAAPFPCLLLKVRGLSLALPLVKLHRILPWTEPTPIPGYQGWLLGMLQQDQGELANLRVVDTALLVMPELVEKGGAAPVAPQHIVIIGNGAWGLTCESVSEVIILDPSKIRWRSARTRRPWLAGTAVEHLCAVLDAEQLAEMLAAGTLQT